MSENRLKRCEYCGGLNLPLATKCEHCGASRFKWKADVDVKDVKVWVGTDLILLSEVNLSG